MTEHWSHEDRLRWAELESSLMLAETPPHHWVSRWVSTWDVDQDIDWCHFLSLLRRLTMEPEGETDDQ